jgi:hypothetical protein
MNGSTEETNKILKDTLLQGFGTNKVPLSFNDTSTHTPESGFVWCAIQVCTTVTFGSWKEMIDGASTAVSAMQGVALAPGFYYGQITELDASSAGLVRCYYQSK